MTIRAYARVSTRKQSIDSQIREFWANDATHIYQETGSGMDRERPELARLLAEIQPGDTLMVVRIDRIARSVAHLMQVIETVQKKKAHFKSLHDPIDTTSAAGMLILPILGAVAQFERTLMVERTKAGIAAARAKGKIPGNPGLMSKDYRVRKAASKKIAQSARTTYSQKVLATKDAWLPVIKAMRPACSWADVVRVLNTQPGEKWNELRLARYVDVAREAGLLVKRPARTRPLNNASLRLRTIVTVLTSLCHNGSWREVAARLEAMGERTPTGARGWTEAAIKAALGSGEPAGEEEEAA